MAESSQGKYQAEPPEAFAYIVRGYTGCTYFENACRSVKVAAAKDSRIRLQRIELAKEDFKLWLKSNPSLVGSHSTSPVCFENIEAKEHFIGGCDALCEYLDGKFSAEVGSAITVDSGDRTDTFPLSIDGTSLLTDAKTGDKLSLSNAVQANKDNKVTVVVLLRHAA